MELMRSMVASGEADYLVPERVWQEFSRGLAEEHPELMLEVLERCGFLRKAFPGLSSWPRRFAGSIPVRFALLAWPLKEAEAEALCKRLRAPGEVRDLALIASRNKERLKASTPQARLELLKRTDAFRRPERFAELLEAARLAEPGIEVAPLQRALQAAAAVDAGAIAKSARGAEIARRVDQARLEAIKALG
jgi:tRNA nucleotidyltransferase (CCA-adding enzyme)